MDEVLTLEQIEARFPSEWVLVDEPELTGALAVVKGKVLWHSPNRDDVYRKARELRPRHSAILYTGTLPDEAAIVLRAFRSMRNVVGGPDTQAGRRLSHVDVR